MRNMPHASLPHAANTNLCWEVLREARRAEALAPPRSQEAAREEKFGPAMNGMGGMGGKISFSNEASVDNPFASGW